MHHDPQNQLENDLDPLVKVSGVSHTYNTGQDSPVEAIDKINLTVRKSQFISLIGPSGCGKTTLLRIIGGLLISTVGEVLIGNNSPKESLRLGRIGFVFQEPILFPWRNTRQNIELPREVLPVKRNYLNVEELIKLVGLEGFEKSFPKELSGGMKSRVAIARALYYKPDVLFMDEPFASLDEVTRDRLNLELLNIWRYSHLTILYVTHSVAEAVFLSDKVVVLSARPARVLAEVDINFDRPRTIKLRKEINFVRLVEDLRELLVNPS